jgi:antitoxin (DNA-binding transcriptional repressor) of toxin-antitoxin stability system
MATNLSEYVHLAEHGETVLVLDQDRVIAELVPPRQASPAQQRESPLAEAIRQGWIRPALKKSGIPPRRPVAPLRELLADLEEHRSDR